MGLATIQLLVTPHIDPGTTLRARYSRTVSHVQIDSAALWNSKLSIFQGEDFVHSPPEARITPPSRGTADWDWPDIIDSSVLRAE